MVMHKIVLGCPRSGTTFLMDCLHAIPHSLCISGHLLPIVIPHLVNHPLSSELYQALLSSFDFSIKDYLEASEKARVPVIIKWYKRTASFQELVLALQGKRKIKHFIYKEPFLSFAPEFTFNALPNARLIYIYRDGRDVADSLIRRYNVLTDAKLMDLNTAEMPLGRKYDHRYVPWWVENGLETEFLECSPYVRAIWMWKEMVCRCNNFFSQETVIASGRVLKVRYEDLVSEPLKLGESIVEHLGCKMEHRLKAKFLEASTSSVGLYKDRDSSEIKKAETCAKNELDFYGYL